MYLPVYGQDSFAETNQGWQLEFTPYFWIPDVDADATVDGTTANMDLSFCDVLDNFDIIGLSGRVEAWNGDWGLFFDTVHVALESDEFKIQTPGPTFGVTVDIQDTTFDFGAAYKLIEEPIGDDDSRKFTFAPLGGLRYHYLKQVIKPRILPNAGGSEDWVEPFVGAAIQYDLTETLAVISRADFGGFGIGSASTLTWNFLLGMDWQFKENMDLKVGYRIQDMDYSRGSGSQEFGFDGQLKGPMMGLTIAF
jgi:predicted porin